ncbi:MBL fold metallo-hydrolase [Candidatus Kaiserbacteria bacterium]|nr:MBL fold metallo-hydrolase [Candidatus Kaiserbacteria bacterium]
MHEYDEDFVRKRLIILGFLILVTFGVWVIPFIDGDLSAKVSGDNQYLKVSFLDVGQGDAIFIETKDKVQALIDGGPNEAVLRQLSSQMGLFDRTIDVVIGTHPDKDHIGGLVDVLDRYKVSMILKTDNVNDTSVSKLYEEKIEQEGAEVIYARRGQKIKLGEFTTIEVLYPETEVKDVESNASSIVVKVVYGDTSFMLSGDSPKQIEEYLVLTSGEHLKSNVLKAGHHGSRTSTSELWLTEVDPDYAVISASSDNRYGHPHQEVIDLLFNYGVEILSTAERGTIEMYSDGLDVWYK